ncbi:hypothetical protein ACIBEJ_00460 [Nonomuraea sp. NPDC050790]|uniref:hypothetical protein n=1 Tax=Nonomuraea sp. NPDC050790 TaxID=3364371 RepID=UPI0037AD2263
MANCCSAPRCTCRVVAGAGVSVEGNGSSSAPYIISAGGGAATALAVQDSPSVDLTLSGTGTAGDPYEVTADVVLDPVPPGGGSNLLSEGPDGLFVECEGVRGCLSAGPGSTYDPSTGVIGAAISTDAGNNLVLGGDDGLFVPAAGATVATADTDCIALTGDGSAGSPLTAGPVIDPDPANALECRPTGLFAPAASGGATALAVNDTDTVDLTLTGTGAAGDPYEVSGAVRLDATPPGGGSNLMGSGPDGLYVECAGVRGCLSAGDGIDYDPATGVIAADLSVDAGNSLSIGGDGGLFAPAATGLTAVTSADSECIDFSGQGTGASPLTATPRLDPAGGNLLSCTPSGLRAVLAAPGCGLAGDGTAASPLAAQVQAWPYPACDVDALAGRVFCDSAGALRSEPRAMATYTQDTVGQNFPSPVVPTGFDNVIVTRTLTITNPDACRNAFVVCEVEVDIDFDLPANSGAAGGITSDEMQYFANRGSSGALDVHCQVTKVYNRQLTPGQVLVEPLDITMGRGSGGATYNRIQSFMRAFIFVL